MAAEWDQLRLFLAVARQGGFAGAGRALRMNETTVARGIAALEHRLGTRLLERTARGLALTAAGERARAAAEAAEAVFRDAASEVGGSDERPSGLVRITATEAISTAVLVPALGRLHAALPDIRFEVFSGYGALDVARGETDIALRPRRPVGTHLVARRLGAVALGVYASSGYLAERGVPEFEKGLRGHSVLGYSDLVQPPPPGEPFLGADLEGARLVLAASTPLGLAAAVDAGMGLATLPCYLAAQRGGLVRVWPERRQSYDMFAVIRSDHRRVLRIRAVLAQLAPYFEALAEDTLAPSEVSPIGGRGPAKAVSPARLRTRKADAGKA